MQVIWYTFTSLLMYSDGDITVARLNVALFCLQITWCQNMMTSMTTGDLAKDVLEAEEQLEMHNERKV